MNRLENILFIGDSLCSLKVGTDSSLALAEAALKLGKKVYWCSEHQLCYFNQEIIVTTADEITLVNKNEISYEKCKISKVKFNFFQVCFVRKDPPFNEEYKSLCWILASQNSVKIINSAESLLAFHEKSLHWRAYAEGVLAKEQMIPTCLTHNLSLVDAFCQQFPESKFVCKPWLGHGGEDILLFEQAKLLREYLEKKEVQNFLVQPFLSEITTEGDRRVIIANGKVICDYVRLPAQGKIAANGAQGGSAILRKMTEEQMQISLNIAKFLKDKNILFAGLDLIGNKVGEINITSPTGIRTYESLSGIQVADEIFQLLVC